MSKLVYNVFYSGIDHELEMIQTAAAMDSLTNNVNTEHNSEFPVGDDQSSTQGNEVSAHLDVQLDRLTLKNNTAGQQCYYAIYMYIYIG